MSKNLPSIALIGFLTFSSFLLNGQTTISLENFSTNTSGTWTAVNVAGPTDGWLFSSGYADINGFSDEVDVDWLISPSLNLDNSTSETFSFKYRDAFDGPDLELYYTLNYTGDPTTTTWVQIPISLTNQSANGTLPAFLTYPNIDISAIAGANVRFGFKYVITAVTAGNAERWQLDDLLVQGTTACVPPTTQATTFSANPSGNSANITWAKGDGSNSLVLVNTTNSFTDPVDGTTYSPNTIYGGGQQVVYNATGTSVNITGLAISTLYYVRIYNFATCTMPIDYITASPLAGNFTTTNNTTTCAQFRANLIATTYTGKYMSLGYDGARRKMYGVCDNQSNTVTCVYGGYVASHPANSTATSITIPGGIINAEHTVPQSFFSQVEPLRGDMHHLFPTVDDWNNDRSNYPFAEIPDISTTKWETGLSTTSTTVPSSNINDYSELLASTSYEPREIQKGNTARAILYFYTMYETVMNTTYSHPITDVCSLQTLYNWHVQDPPTAADVSRNDCIEANQGNRNPYIDHPEWVAPAFIGSSAGCLLAALPIELIYFEGKNKGDFNTLNWRTAREKNAAYHAVERKENDRWIEIGRVKAAGNSEEPQNYTLDDTKPLPLSIYRLRTVDLDGTESVSKVITIAQNKQAFSLKMFPNPAKDFVTFRTTTDENQKFNVTITDITGRAMIQKEYDITSGGVDQHINIAALPSGLYFFTFDNGVTKVTERFVRQ